MTRATIIRNLCPFAVALICMAAPWFLAAQIGWPS